MLWVLAIVGKNYDKIINMNCPLCNSLEMVPIWYGYPTMDDIALSRANKVVLGGPNVKEYTHYCLSCQETYPLIEIPYED